MNTNKVRAKYGEAAPAELTEALDAVDQLCQELVKARQSEKDLVGKLRKAEDNERNYQATLRTCLTELEIGTPTRQLVTFIRETLDESDPVAQAPRQNRSSGDWRYISYNPAMYIPTFEPPWGPTNPTE